MVVINNAYFADLENKIRNGAAAQPPSALNQYKEDLVKAGGGESCNQEFPDNRYSPGSIV